METRALARPDVAFTSTAPRVTPTGPRASRFGEVLSNTVVQSAESAMRVLPGSPTMALAVRGATGTGTALGVPLATTGGMASAQGPVAAGSRVQNPATSLTNGGAITGLGGATGAGGETGAVESSLQQSQDMTMYYLSLQQRINEENRSYTALSNVMKAEHETVKTAIGNIR